MQRSCREASPGGGNLLVFRGMFVVLEGIDGSGTTTQVARLGAALAARGADVHATREPSDGPTGRLIREVLAGRVASPPHALALLFAADRLEHVAREVEPALARGAVVLCDRYLGSSLVYQGMTCDLEWVRTLNRHARPADLTLVLDVPAEEGERRRQARGGEPELFEGADLQARLARAYRELPALLPGEPVIVVEATGTPEAVEARLLRLVLEAHGSR
jgi:dTMP kinase